MIVNIALMTYYIYLARCNDELSPSGKNLWTVLLFVFGSITMIVYLFMYVYFKPEDKLRIQLNITRSNKKTWTGVILALPFGMLILFFISMMGFMDSMFKTIAFESGNELSIMAGMMSFIVLEIVFFLVLMGVGIYFIVEAVRNEAFTTNEKVMWSLMIFFFNLIAMVVYWFLFMLQEPTNKEVTVE